MAKCIRCGRSGMGVLHQAIKLKDKNFICFKCYKELGGQPMKDMTTAPLTYTYEDIKDGFEAMYDRRIEERIIKADEEAAAKYGMTTKLISQLDQAEATDNEKKILGAICAVLEDEGRDVDCIDAALGDNGSLLLMIDGTVFIQYKSEPNVKWIRFCNEGEEKIRIGGAGRMNSFADRIVAAYDSVPL